MLWTAIKLPFSRHSILKLSVFFFRGNFFFVVAYHNPRSYLKKNKSAPTSFVMFIPILVRPQTLFNGKVLKEYHYIRYKLAV